MYNYYYFFFLGFSQQSLRKPRLSRASTRTLREKCLFLQLSYEHYELKVRSFNILKLPIKIYERIKRIKSVICGISQTVDFNF